MAQTFDDPAREPGAFGRAWRYLVSPLRRLSSRNDDPQALRASQMSDAELADALEREIYAAHNADDEIWVEGLTFVQEAARRLRDGRGDAAA